MTLAVPRRLVAVRTRSVAAAPALTETWATFTLLANAAATEAARLRAEAREIERDVADMCETQSRLQADAARYTTCRTLTNREAADAAWLARKLPELAADIGRFEMQVIAKRARAALFAAEAKRLRAMAGKGA